jgi:DNA-binding NarL/FixJ family response regulator
MALRTRNASGKPMAVLIVDDHPLFREGLKQVLQGLAEDTEVIAESNATSALEAAKSLDLDLVLLDLSMPGMDGFTAVERFGKAAPGVPVVIISGHEEESEVRRALSLGALGYIPKSTPPNILLDALRLVLGGGVYVPPVLLRAVQSQPLERPVREANGFAAPASSEQLTERQVEVLRLLAQGQSNKVIARELDLSDKTVKGHITSIFRALGVVNRTQAALEARKHGLIK